MRNKRTVASRAVLVLSLAAALAAGATASASAALAAQHSTTVAGDTGGTGDVTHDW